MSTTSQYGGLVEVIVSGTGTSYGQLVNDAFYDVPSGIPVDYSGSGSLFQTRYYQLNLGWQNGFGLLGCDDEPYNINNAIVFIDGVGSVSPPAMPSYEPVTHRYDFVVRVPEDAGQLNFGDADCGCFSLRRNAHAEPFHPAQAEDLRLPHRLDAGPSRGRRKL